MTISTGTPVVMITPGNPVGTGFIKSLEDPGANITGLTTIATELAGKRLDVLRELLPDLSGLAVIWDPSNPVREREWSRTERAAQAIGVPIRSFPISGPGDFEPAFQAAIEGGANAFMLLSDPVFVRNRARFLELVEKYRAPVMYENESYPDNGGLISYGPRLADQYRRSAWYVDKILRGADPGKLPVQEPTSFVLTVNIRAAEALGLTIPDGILVRANRLIN
jgi:putative ABC transport system substrate-binding protein